MLRSRIDVIPCGTDAAFLPRSCLGLDHPPLYWPPAPPAPYPCVVTPLTAADAPVLADGDTCIAEGPPAELDCFSCIATCTTCDDDMSGISTTCGAW